MNSPYHDGFNRAEKRHQHVVVALDDAVDRGRTDGGRVAPVIVRIAASILPVVESGGRRVMAMVVLLPVRRVCSSSSS